MTRREVSGERRRAHRTDRQTDWRRAIARSAIRRVPRAGRLDLALLSKLALATAIWLVAVVSTASLTVWAIGKADDQLGTSTTSTNLPGSQPSAPRGQIPDLSAGARAPASAATGSRSPAASSRSRPVPTAPRSTRPVQPTGQDSSAAGRTSTPATSAAGSAQDSQLPRTSAATSASPQQATDNGSSPTPAGTTGSASQPTGTRTTGTLVVAVKATQPTVGGSVTATCAGTDLISWSATPGDGWSAVEPGDEPKGQHTGFINDQARIDVQISCADGDGPDFRVETRLL